MHRENIVPRVIGVRDNKREARAWPRALAPACRAPGVHGDVTPRTQSCDVIGSLPPVYDYVATLYGICRLL